MMRWNERVWLKNIDRSHVYRIALYILLIAALIPYTKTGYMGDDIRNSLFKGYCINQNQSLVDAIWSYYQTLLFSYGRIYVVTMTIQYVILYFMSPYRMLYKIWIIVATVCSVYIAERFVDYHFKDKRAGNVFLTLTIAFFPIYLIGSNSLMMYWGFMQMEVIIFFAILWLLEVYLRTSRGKYLICSCILFLISLFMYEANYLFLIAIIIIAYSCKRENAKRTVVPYALMWIGALAINMFCLTYSTRVYNGVAVNIDILAMLQTFCVQFVGAIPMYSLMTEALNADGKGELIWIVAALVGLAVFLCALTLFVRECKLCQRRENSGFKNPMIATAAIGFLVWSGIAAMIAMSQKYQSEIPVSKAPHIPVYIEYFAMVLVALSVYLYMDEAARIKPVIKKCVLAAVGILGITNYCISEAYIAGFIQDTKALYVDMPELYKNAVENGLIDQIGEDSRIVIDISYSPTIYEDVFAQYSDKSVNAVRMDMFLSEITDTRLLDDQYYPEHDLYITKSFCSETQNVVYLEKVNYIELDDSGTAIDKVDITDIIVYCETKVPINSLTTTLQGELNIVEYTDCAVKYIDENRYLIQLPRGEYDYYSYTFWN